MKRCRVIYCLGFALGALAPWSPVHAAQAHPHYTCLVVQNGQTFSTGTNSDVLEDDYEGSFNAVCTGD